MFRLLMSSQMALVGEAVFKWSQPYLTLSYLTLSCLDCL